MDCMYLSRLAGLRWMRDLSSEPCTSTSRVDFRIGLFGIGTHDYRRYILDEEPDFPAMLRALSFTERPAYRSKLRPARPRIPAETPQRPRFVMSESLVGVLETPVMALHLDRKYSSAFLPVNGLSATWCATRVTTARESTASIVRWSAPFSMRLTSSIRASSLTSCSSSRTLRRF